MGVDAGDDIVGQRTKGVDVCERLRIEVDAEVGGREVPVGVRRGVGENVEHLVGAVGVGMSRQSGVIDWAGSPFGVMVLSPDAEGRAEHPVEIGECGFGQEIGEDVGHVVDQAGP